MLSPFPYQIAAIERLREGFRQGKRRGLLTMLMGGGKSVAALELMRLCAEKGHRSLFLCDRRMLATQIIDVAQGQGLDCGLILAGHGHKLQEPCQFGSKQTIISWLKRERIQLPDFQLVIVDEAHRAVSKEWQELKSRFPNAYVVGLTATPCLGNGGGMGAYYDFLVEPIKPSGLKTLGRIVPCRCYAPHIPNLRGLKRDSNGDYSSADLSQRMNRKNLIGEVAKWWLKYGERRPSLYFGCDIPHAMAIRDEFASNGITAEVICDETPDEVRQEIARRSKNCQTQVVVNVDVLAEGIDWPWISCIGLIRPTKRLRRYLQNAGRGMRAYPGKENCIIIDHAGCVLYHGFPDRDQNWTLDAKDNIDVINQKKKPKEQAMLRCSQCNCCFTGQRTCPECGHMNQWAKSAKEHGTKSGTLIEIGQTDLPKEVEMILYNRYWHTCIYVAVSRQGKAGMAAAMFANKFGKTPWDARVQPLAVNWQAPSWEQFPGFARKRR